MRHDQAPDWRWLRAQEIADAHSSPRRVGDDKYVKKAYKFLMRMRRNDPKVDARLKSEYPQLYHAFRMYDNPTPMRWMLEAGVMADQPPSELALYLNTDEHIIETYERTFFDVRDALNNPGCIRANVLGLAVTASGTLPDSPDILWKVIAYEGGWDAVQGLFEAGYIKPATLDYYRKSYLNGLIKNGMLSTRLIRTTGYNSSDRERLALDLVQKEEEIGAVRGGDQAHNAMGGLLKSIKLSVMGARQQQLAEEPRLQHVELPAPRPVEVEVEESKEKKK